MSRANDSSGVCVHAWRIVLYLGFDGVEILVTGHPCSFDDDGAATVFGRRPRKTGHENGKIRQRRIRRRDGLDTAGDAGAWRLWGASRLSQKLTFSAVCC